MAADTAKCAKALFKNVSRIVYSISAREDIRDGPSQPKRDAGSRDLF
jgi:hypothetical protein